MIFLETTSAKKMLADTSISVVWHPADEAIRDLVFHSNSFDFGTPETVILDYETSSARPSMAAALNSYFGQEMYSSILPINDRIDSALKDAIAFGDQIMMQFKRESILLGISYSDKIPYVHSILHILNHMLEAGSAKEAIKEVDRVIALADSFVISHDRLEPDGTISVLEYTKGELAPFVTNARLRSFKNQLEDYYGLPRT